MPRRFALIALPAVAALLCLLAVFGTSAGQIPNPSGERTPEVAQTGPNLAPAVVRVTDVAAPATPQFEFRAVKFGSDEKAETKLLNDLNGDGWEYVGPLANGLVAFRRDPALNETRADGKRVQGTWNSTENKLVPATVAPNPEGWAMLVDKKYSLTISGNSYVLRADNKVLHHGTIQLLNTGGLSSNQIDLLAVGGPEGGRRYHGTYTIKDDSLGISLDNGGAKQPSRLPVSMNFSRVAEKK